MYTNQIETDIKKEIHLQEYKGIYRIKSCNFERNPQDYYPRKSCKDLLLNQKCIFCSEKESFEKEKSRKLMMIERHMSNFRKMLDILERK